MTNQQLKAHCEDVIANPQDHLDWVVDMARVTLASLEAEPAAKRGSTQIGGLTMFPFELAIDHADGTLYYTAPPAPEVKLPDPINWKEAHLLLNVNQCGEDRFEAFKMGANWQLDEIKRLNGVTS